MSALASVACAPQAAAHRLGLVHCTNEQYHGGPGVSKSHLDVIARSPAHYWQAYVNPVREPRVPTPAMVVGTAIHAAILEPDLFTSGFIVAPEINKRTNAGKAEYAAFLDEHEDYTVLSTEQWQVALGARDSAHRHPLVRERLKRGAAEQSYYALDPGTGALIKCRFDWLDVGGAPHALDVKSTEDASPERFMRSVLDYRYHVQQAWYEHTFGAATDYELALREWVFLAIEKTPPFACAAYTLPPEMVRAGQQQAQRELARIQECRLRDHWPAYGDECVQLDVPRWAANMLGMNSPEHDFEGLE